MGGRKAVIRKELVELVGGRSWRAAVILDQLIEATLIVRELNRIESAAMRDSKVPEEVIQDQMRGGWLVRSANELGRVMAVPTSDTAIRENLQTLVDLGLVEKRKNTKNLLDQSNEYRVDLCQIDTELKKLGYYLGWSETRWESTAAETVDAATESADATTEIDVPSSIHTCTRIVESNEESNDYVESNAERVLYAESIRSDSKETNNSPKENKKRKGSLSDGQTHLFVSADAEAEPGCLEENISGEEAVADEPQDPIRQVFDHWVEVSGYSAKLTAGRRAKIKRRLDTFSVEELIQAIDGGHLDPFYLGQNNRGKKYNWIETLLKNDEAVERHITTFNNGPPRRPGAVKQAKGVVDDETRNNVKGRRL